MSSSRFNCFRRETSTSSTPVVLHGDGSTVPVPSRCAPRPQVPAPGPVERRCSLQDPAVQRCVAAELTCTPARRLPGPTSARRRCCSLVQCGAPPADGAPAGWSQFSPGGPGRKDLATVSSPGVSPSSSSRSLQYLLHSPVRR